jgi:hypothetical protein
MFSVLQQGLKAWEVYFHQEVPIWKVVTDTTRYFELDGYLYLSLKKRNDRRSDVSSRTETVEHTDERIVTRTTIETPRGQLVQEQTYLASETPTTTQGFVKDVDDFVTWMEYCLPIDSDYTWEHMVPAIEYMGDDGVAAGTTGIPGLASLTNVFDERLAGATFLAYDRPDLLEEYRERHERVILRQLEVLIDSPVDYIQIGSSGMLTLSTPELVRKLSLPTIQKATKMCKEAGVVTELHCCGKESLVVEMCHDETDLDSINPLQPSPMGDCDLAEVKKRYGDTLTLKGNVGVTDPLLNGTPDDVERDVIRCMDAAKEGGRFILFSEEGIGALTPAENVRRYVEAGKHYGTY